MSPLLIFVFTLLIELIVLYLEYSFLAASWVLTGDLDLLSSGEGDRSGELDLCCDYLLVLGLLLANVLNGEAVFFPYVLAILRVRLGEYEFSEVSSALASDVCFLWLF